MLKKEGKILIVSLVALIILSQFSSATLGITPARVERNFKPGLESEFTFSVSSDKPNQEITIYKRGNLEKYVTLSKKTIYGAGRFRAKVNLPEEIGEPGEHEIIIGAKEKIDKEVVTVGTSLAVQAVMSYFVPYPGKYLDLKFNPKSANQGETIPMIMEISNEGKQNVTMKPRIEIMKSDGKKIETIKLSERTLPEGESIKLQGTFNTSGHHPGNYRAKAIVDYAGKSTTEAGNFTIGHLFVNVTGQTKNTTVGGIREFNVEAKSEWGRTIDNVYADVEVIENISSRKVFRTTPKDMGPWEKANLTGYFNTKNMTPKTYDTRIFLNYRENQTVKKGEIQITEKKNKSGKIPTPVIAGLAIIILIMLIFIIAMQRRNKDEKD